MGKMFDKKFVAGIVFGAVTFMAFSVNADITYNAEGVLYKKGNSNVVLKDELDNLNSYINYGNATAADVLAGKTFVSSGKKLTGTAKTYNEGYTDGKNASNLHVVSLGNSSGGSFLTVDCTSYDGWQNFTANNFAWKNYSLTNTGGSDYSSAQTISYNSTTGKVTARAGYYNANGAGITVFATLYLYY